MKIFLATFYTHFGAVKFNKDCKSLSVKARQMPVPRVLSSSCGTCVRFEADDYLSVLKQCDFDDIEGCYLVCGDGTYTPLAME